MNHTIVPTRRHFLNLLACVSAATLAGCTIPSRRQVVYYDNGPGQLPSSTGSGEAYGGGVVRGQRTPELDAMYGNIADGGFVIPAIPYWQIDPRYYRQRVSDPTGERPGTIVVNTPSRFLYLVEPGGTAMRYGVGIGRDGFSWSGEGVIQWRQKWPKWTPPDEMIARQPELVKYSADNGGMPPGLNNPLGARALYIFQNGADTLYRLHGNPEWNSIGRAVSSGCVRLLNQDIIDLYGRVPEKARIIVWQ